MPKLKVLSGKDLIKILEIFGFFIHSQRGSHIKMIRITKENHRQTLTVPNHTELDKGTLGGILKQASAFIPENELKPHFYTA